MSFWRHENADRLPEPKPVRRALVHVVIGVAFVDTLAQLPLIAPFAGDMGATPVWVGAVVAAYSLANMLANVAFGPLIDTWGRRPAMGLGMGIAAVALSLYPHAGSYTVLFALRVVHGLGGGVLIPAAFAYATDRPGRGGSPMAMSRVGIAIGVAALLGPAGGGALATWLGAPAVFRGIAGLMAVTALIAMVWLPATEAVTARPRLRDFAQYRRLLATPGFVGALVAVLGLAFGKGVLAMGFPLRAVSLGYPSVQVGMALSVFAALAMVTFVVGRRARRETLDARIVVGLILGALALLGLALAERMAWFAALTGVFGVGFGLVFPASGVRVADAAGTKATGRGFALYHSSFSLGIVAGPLLAGIVEVWWGWPPLLVGVVGVAVAAVCTGLCARRA